MKTVKTRKLTPFEEREQNIRHTLTTSIIQKLQRMSTLELRETYNYTVDVMERKKRHR